MCYIVRLHINEGNKQCPVWLTRENTSQPSLHYQLEAAVCWYSVQSDCIRSCPTSVSDCERLWEDDIVEARTGCSSGFNRIISSHSACLGFQLHFIKVGGGLGWVDDSSVTQSSRFKIFYLRFIVQNITQPLLRTRRGRNKLN